METANIQRKRMIAFLLCSQLRMKDRNIEARTVEDVTCDQTGICFQRKSA